STHSRRCNQPQGRLGASDERATLDWAYGWHTRGCWGGVGGVGGTHPSGGAALGHASTLLSVWRLSLGKRYDRAHDPIIGRVAWGAPLDGNCASTLILV